MAYPYGILRLAHHTIQSNSAPEHRRLTATIIVGYQEKHEVTYDLNHWESVERVYVDRALVILKPMRVHLFSRTRQIELTVGVAEKHHVLIEFEMSTASKDQGVKTLRMIVDGYLISTTQV